MVTKVILFRGFGGNIFSTGMDALCEKIRDKCKLETEVLPYEDWYDLYVNLKKTSNTTVLIGHSFGALAIYKIASLLNKRNWPLLISYDYSPFYSGIIRHVPDGIVPDNVIKSLNFYQNVDPLVRGVKMTRKDGSERNIRNVLTEYAHCEIDKVNHLHNDTITAIKYNV